MPDTEEMMKLAERLEQATGPDRELDATIAVAIEYDLPLPMGECPASLRLPVTPSLKRFLEGEAVEAGCYWLVQRSGMSLRTAPHFSSSLDAAMLLVPEGWERFDVDATAPELGIDWTLHGPERLEAKGTAATPALALAAASLRARANGGGE